MTKGELQVVRANQLRLDPVQTPGMNRYAGVSAHTVGSEKLWVGYVTLAPGVRSGPHHHGACESAIFIIKGHARFRLGPDLEKSIDVAAGDFIYVPPWAVHQEINTSDTEPIEMIVARDNQENVTVNLDLPATSPPEA